MDNLHYIIGFIAYSIILLFSAFLLLLVWFYIQDKIQTVHAVRHNFPVLGRLRYQFESWGTFFRQYFFALDREEMPFNRAQRSWVYRAAKDIDTTVPFGSTRNLSTPGTVFFSNAMYPVLAGKEEEDIQLVFGPYTENPYKCRQYFNISAMSYGAISRPAVQALSRGAKMAGIWLNTGEGGLSPFHLEGGCDLVVQIGTGKFGVRDEQGNLCDQKLQQLAEHPTVKMFEIKLSQGAKPGKGGILPAEKVTEEIAKIRGLPQGQAAISPNRFSEVESPGDLLKLIQRVRNITGKPTGIKLCAGNMRELEEMFTLISKTGSESAPDFITIDSGDGGTGAAPMSLIDNVGMLINESLPLLVNLLRKYDLRDRIKVIASGKLINPTDVAWALCAGADAINSARGFMFSLGCIQALQCNKNTCPTGVTTHDKKLQAGLNPYNKAHRVAHYAQNIHKEVSIIAHSCGVNSAHQLKREHARVITPDGKSICYSEAYPEN